MKRIWYSIVIKLWILLTTPVYDPPEVPLEGDLRGGCYRAGWVGLSQCERKFEGLWQSCTLNSGSYDG